MGTKRIGVAISNTEHTFAFPLTVLDSSPELLSKILALTKPENVQTIVIGESKDFKQKDNPIMKKVHDFTAELQKLGYQVVHEPEFLSSAQAERFQGKNDLIDASAATIILQSYLDRKQNAK